MHYLWFICYLNIFYSFVNINKAMPKLIGSLQFTGSMDNMTAYKRLGLTRSN